MIIYIYIYIYIRVSISVYIIINTSFIGGKWMVKLKKGLASSYWEEIVLAMIGEQFDVGNEICGAVCR
jgi:hypothetical protein